MASTSQGPGVSQHLAFFPVYGLNISKDVGGELTIGRVTFVDANRIDRIHKRLGFPNPVSFYRNKSYIKNLFKQAPVYACLKSLRAKSSRDFDKEYKAVTEAFWLLASSFFYETDRDRVTISLAPHAAFSTFDDISVFDRASDAHFMHYRRRGMVVPQSLDRDWKRISRHHFFPYVKQITNGTREVKSKLWKDSILRAATLCGQSLLARHVAEAFFNNMVAIETLLTKRGDKFPDALVNRLAALFGWMTGEEIEPWQDLIGRLYKLRCSYVHDGIRGDITGMDLFDADTLVTNLLINLGRNTSSITSKEDLLRLADNCSARRTLGIRAKRPKTLTYQKRYLSNSQLERINDLSRWSW